MMRITVPVPVQLGPPDRLVLFCTAALHAPDRHTNQGKDDRADTDGDANNGAFGNGRPVVAFVAVA
jgi:hypothetical protein